MFVGGVVVEDTWNRLIAATLRSTAFRTGVALHSAAGDGAVEHAEGGERGSDAMQLVVERHGLTAPWLGRQAGLGAIERLNLAFSSMTVLRRGSAHQHRAG